MVRTDTFQFNVIDSNTKQLEIYDPAEVSDVFLPSAYFFQILTGYKSIQVFFLMRYIKVSD